MFELVFDAQLAAWVSVNLITLRQERVIKDFRNKRRGFYPYAFNFVFGRRDEDAQCSFCGKFIPMRKMTRDHVYPKSMGGEITTTACYECNTKKRDTKPIEFAIWASETGFALRH